VLIEEGFTVASRPFRLRLLRYANGCLLSLSEGGEDRLGGLHLALRQEKTISSTTIIPDRFGGVFLEILGRSVANHISGIVITSLYLKSALTPAEASEILNKITEILSASTQLSS
jgi:hypothetical protein